MWMLQWVDISSNVSRALYNLHLVFVSCPSVIGATLVVQRFLVADEAVLLRLDFNGVLTAWRQKEDEHGQTEKSVLAQGGL